jgi:hypothetical protein
MKLRIDIPDELVEPLRSWESVSRTFGEARAAFGKACPANTPTRLDIELSNLCECELNRHIALLDHLHRIARAAIWAGDARESVPARGDRAAFHRAIRDFETAQANLKDLIASTVDNLTTLAERTGLYRASLCAASEDPVRTIADQYLYSELRLAEGRAYPRDGERLYDSYVVDIRVNLRGDDTPSTVVVLNMREAFFLQDDLGLALARSAGVMLDDAGPDRAID